MFFKTISYYKLPHSLARVFSRGGGGCRKRKSSACDIGGVAVLGVMGDGAFGTTDTKMGCIRCHATNRAISWSDADNASVLGTQSGRIATVHVMTGVQTPAHQPQVLYSDEATARVSRLNADRSAKIGSVDRQLPMTTNQ